VKTNLSFNSPFSRIFISRQKKLENIDIFMNFDLFGEKHPCFEEKTAGWHFNHDKLWKEIILILMSDDL
jgi:hypothetical protein